MPARWLRFQKASGHLAHRCTRCTRCVHAFTSIFSQHLVTLPSVHDRHHDVAVPSLNNTKPCNILKYVIIPYSIGTVAQTFSGTSSNQILPNIDQMLQWHLLNSLPEGEETMTYTSLGRSQDQRTKQNDMRSFTGHRLQGSKQVLTLSHHVSPA